MMSLFFYNLTAVISAAATDNGLHDIKGPAPIALPLREILIVSGITALLLFLLWFFIRLYRKRKERPAPPERVPSPEERALKSLNDPLLLEALARGDFKLFYFALSDAIREYIAGRYSIDAMDSTTHELLSELAHKGESSVIFSTTEAFFTQCDLVKFAKSRPSVEEARGSLKAALHIVSTCEEFFAEKARVDAMKMEEAVPA